MRRALPLTAVWLALVACDSGSSAAPAGLDAAELEPRPIPRPPEAKPPADDSFTVVLQSGGFGHEDLFGVDISGTSKEARATCAIEPSQRAGGDVHPWKRSATLDAEQVAKLWEPLERLEWDALKSHGRARDQGSASLTFRKGSRLREFVAQKDCGCDASPKPPCCAGGDVIRSLRGLCFSPQLNVPPNDPSWKIVLTRKSPDRRFETITRIEGDEHGAAATRESRESSQKLQVWVGTLPAETVATLWKAFDAAAWPRLHQLNPQNAKHERILTIERGHLWASIDLDAEGSEEAAALSLEVDRAAADPNVHELTPNTEISLAPTRRPIPGVKTIAATCKLTEEGVSCQTDPERSELYGTLCFPWSAGPNLFLCAPTPSEQVGIPVRALRPVKLPATPWPWSMVLVNGDVCTGPPPVTCGRTEVTRLIEGKKGWFVQVKNSDLPIGVRRMYSQPWARKKP